jgi:hypothetical protein
MGATQSSITRFEDIIRVQEGTIVEGAEFRLALDNLRELAKGLVVTDQASATEAKEIVKKCTDITNQITAIAEPERLRRKGLLSEWTNMRDKMIAEFTSISSPLDTAVRKFNLAEQDGARAEQTKLNKGKRAEDRVVVQPNIARVPGTRFQPRYRAEIVDVSKIRRDWLLDALTRDPGRAWLKTAAEAQARQDKDPATTEKKIGGVRVHKE